MTTTKQIQIQRTQLRAQLERDRRAKDRKQLASLRAHVQHARKLKVSRMREVRIACKQARLRLRAVKRALAARYAADLAQARERERLASRRNCSAEQERVRAKSVDRFHRASRSLAAERAHQEQARIWARRSPLKPAPRRATAIHESDSEVLNNIPADLAPVWRAVRTRIKSTPRRSRTETFLEWIQEHPGEVQRIVTRQIDRDVEELIAHEHELRKRVMSPRHYRAMSERELRAAVPF